MPKDWGTLFNGQLQEREVLFIIETLEEMARDRPILGMHDMLKRLKSFVPA